MCTGRFPRRPFQALQSPRDMFSAPSPPARNHHTAKAIEFVMMGKNFVGAGRHLSRPGREPGPLI